MGRMFLTVLGMVAEMELGLSVIGNALASTLRRRRGSTRAARLFSTAAESSPYAKKGLGAMAIARAVGCQRGNVYRR